MDLDLTADRQAIVAEHAEADADLDAALLTRWLDGDERAFTALFGRHRAGLYAIVMRYVGDHDEAAEIVQLSFIKAMRKAASLRRRRRFKAWLYRIGINLAISALRRRKRRPTVPVEDANLTVDATAPGQLLDEERRQQLLAAVDVLTPMQRKVVELRVFGGLSYDETAVAAGTTPGSARVHMHNALKRLSAELGDETSGPPSRGG